MDKLFVADTNVLLDSIEQLQNYKIVLLSHTLRELDKHKMSKNGELAFKARKAVRYIKDNLDKFIFDAKDYNGLTLGNDYDNSYQDNNILTACVQNQYGLITNDVLLQFKGKGFGLEVIDFDDVKENDEYKGYKFVDLDEEEMANFYENLNQNTYDLLVNQYLIIRDKDHHTVDKYRWNGTEHIKLKLPPKRFVKPENDLQECALDLLNDQSTPVKIIAGTFGSGKTYLAVKMGIYHLNEKGNFAKLMIVRNPIGTGEAIGWLKRTKEDKTDDFFTPVIQNLDGGEFEAQQMIQHGTLLKQVPYFMKGITVDDTYMLVDEAEDLDTKLIKTIGTRIGKEACAVFSGDYNQSEDKFMQDNGLMVAINKLKGDPLVGIIVLDRDVRSSASKLFADL